MPASACGQSCRAHSNCPLMQSGNNRPEQVAPRRQERARRQVLAVPSPDDACGGGVSRGGVASDWVPGSRHSKSARRRGRRPGPKQQPPRCGHGESGTGRRGRQARGSSCENQRSERCEPEQEDLASARQGLPVRPADWACSPRSECPGWDRTRYVGGRDPLGKFVEDRQVAGPGHGHAAECGHCLAVGRGDQFRPVVQHAGHLFERVGTDQVVDRVDTALMPS